MRYWVLAPDGRGAAGPYEIAQLKQLPGFEPTSVIAPENATSADAWKPAHSFDDLRSLFIKPPTLPPPRPLPAWPPASPPVSRPTPQAATPASHQPTPQPASGAAGGDSAPVPQRPAASPPPKSAAGFSGAWMAFAAVAATAVILSAPALRAWLSRRQQAAAHGATRVLPAKPLNDVAPKTARPAVMHGRRPAPNPRSRTAQKGATARPLDVKMLRAAKACRWTNVRNLAHHGANINVSDSRGESPLALAIGKCRGDLNAATFLIAQGARVNAPDRVGRTPLCDALLFEHPNIVRLLLKSGADPAVPCEVAALLTLASRRRVICGGPARQDHAMLDFPPPTGAKSPTGPCPYDKIYDEIIGLLSNAQAASSRMRSP